MYKTSYRLPFFRFTSTHVYTVIAADVISFCCDFKQLDLMTSAVYAAAAY